MFFFSGRPNPDLMFGALKMNQKRRLACAAMLALTVPAGLIWRLAPSHLSPFAFKYGGSALWAMAVYWVVGLLLPSRRPVLLGVIAAVVATAVECFKRVRSIPLDAFRNTLEGRLLLGRYFTVGALVAYVLAILAVAIADALLNPGRRKAGYSVPF